MRYSDELRHRLDIAKDPQVRMLSDQAYAIEDAMAELPATPQGVNAFLELTAKVDLLRLSALRMLPPGGPVPGEGPLSLFARLRPDLRDDALIGFATYQPVSQGANPKLVPVRYLRYCLSATEHQICDAGDQRTLDRAIRTWRAAIIGKTDTAAVGQVVAQALLRDLPGTVVAARTWRIDPEGIIALVPFDALPDASGKPLLLKHAIRVLNGVAKPVQPLQADAQRSAVRPAGGLIVANPEYGTNRLPMADTSPGAPGPLAPRSMATHWKQGAMVAPLPETLAEARVVAEALQRIGFDSRTLLGREATSAALLSSAPPIILHIAAHAVIFEKAPGATDSDEENPANAIMDLALPGRRSGLILSRDGQPDVMLAKDVARLSLRGTSLVVLSACNTGNGDVVAGEGMMSLRHCVEAAGAGTTVSSLWPVPSAATVALMTYFYAALAQGQSICQALSTAKEVLLGSGRPAIEWAGFQMAGADVVLSADAA